MQSDHIWKKITEIGIFTYQILNVHCVLQFIQLRALRHFFALYGFHMFTSGTDYKLARKLLSLSDHKIIQGNRNEKLKLIREKNKENLYKAYERSAARYKKKARNIQFRPGQEVYRRNSVLSDFKSNINAKFCRMFLKCRVVKPVGNNMYELESLNGKSIGIFHVKDIKV